MQKTTMLAILLTLPILGCGVGSEPPKRSRLTERPTAKPEPARRLTLPTVTILSPKPNEVIATNIYDDMVFQTTAVSDGVRHWVFARDRGGVYLQYPPPLLEGRTGRARVKNIRLATPGDDWELLVCVATAEASDRLHASARRGEWSFPTLPPGVEHLQGVTVARR